MQVSIKNQKFGFEIELTGIDRRNAAGIVADYFNSDFACVGNDYVITDSENRAWKVVRDSSIQANNDNQKVEIVSPYAVTKTLK